METNSGSVTQTFTVSLNGPTSTQVSVTYTASTGTVGDIATVTEDFTATNAVLSFQAGQTSATFNVSVKGDLKYEGNEDYKVTLSGPNNAILGTPSVATATITNDDVPPSVTIADKSYAEGNTGALAKTMTVTLAPASGKAATVNYQTMAGTAGAPGDYTTKSGTLTFAKGITTATFGIPVIGDTLDETDETVFVNLSSCVDCTITDNQATLTITDDDAAGAFEFSAATFPTAPTKEALATDVNVLVTVKRTGGTASGATVQFATSNGTAVAPGDYTTSAGTLTFAAGQLTRTFNVPVKHDIVPEQNESFFLDLFNPGGGATASLGVQRTAMITILDNEPIVKFSSNTWRFFFFFVSVLGRVSYC